MPLLLTSLAFDGLDAWLDGHGVAGPVAVVTNASRGLDDRDAIVAMARDALAGAGCPAQTVDVRENAGRALAAAGAVVMAGGDPFRLLADLRDSGADRLLQNAHTRGVPIAGQSAGAMVCATDLTPARITSPFAAPAGLELTGLGLIDSLVLPHHGRPGRNARHRRAALTAAAPTALVILWDDEVLTIDAGTWALHRDRRITRPARHADAAAVAEVFHQAGLRAWGPFLGHDRLERERQPDSVWAARIAAAGCGFLVTEDAAGVCGFVSWKPTADEHTGELDLLYTHPRVWGAGDGRRLLERATWRLLCEGFQDAVLWTEARNERALAVYRANGWTADGAVDERDYAGTRIRNLRHRLDLRRYAGGA